MKLVQRPYQTEADYWALRSFLRDVFLRNGRREHSWIAAHLDYWRWHVAANCGGCPIEDGIYLWEDEGGRIIAAVTCEERGRASLQVDPRFRTPELEEEMLSLAEERLGGISPSSGRFALALGTMESDTLREEILARRGYEKKPDWQAFDRHRDLTLPIPDVPAADGYEIRPMRLEDIPSRSWASWRTFHPDEPDENYSGSDWYAYVMRAPLYRRDLDLVAVSDDGDVAAFATVWYDDVTRSGFFEPVGTVPEHQRRGLCTALLHEGFRRLIERGAIHTLVGGGGLANPIAEGVYSRASTDEDSWSGWVKYLDGGSS